MTLKRFTCLPVRQPLTRHDAERSGSLTLIHNRSRSSHSVIDPAW
jgi:hypothetical protein